MLIEVSLFAIVYVQSLQEHGHDFGKKKNANFNVYKVL